MRVADIALKFFKHGVAEWAFWQHAFDGVLQHAIRVFVLQLFKVSRRHAARVTGVAVIRFLKSFFAGNAELFHVGHDDEVTGVHVRRKNRFVLTAKADCNLAGETAEDFVGAIDQKPVRLNVGRFGGKGFHYFRLV